MCLETRASTLDRGHHLLQRPRLAPNWCFLECKSMHCCARSCLHLCKHVAARSLRGACDADGLRSYVLPASTTSQPRERAQVLLAAGSPSRWRLVAELVDQDPHILRIVVRRSAQRHSFKTELIFVAMRIAIRRPARSDTLFVTSCARSGAVQYRQRLARCSRRRPLVAIGSRAISAR